MGLVCGSRVSGALNLTLTALDASSNPAFSNASVALSSSSPTGQFSVDQGNTWTSTQSVNLVNGQYVLLYKDTKAGVSTANTSCMLSNPSASTTIIAGVPALISGGANPNALNISAPNNTSNLFTLVSDVYGNPVSGTTVTFVVAPPTTSSVASPTVVTDAFGMATDVFTFNSATADSGVYVCASVAGVKPTIASLSLSSSNPTKLNLSPAPSTTGVNISTLMTLLAQDASSVSGYSNHTVRLSSNSANLSFSGDNGGTWGTILDVSMTASPTSTATPTDTATATDTPTASATSTITPTLTATLTPQFAFSGTDKTVIAPSFLRRGDTMKLFFAERPASCKVEVFTMAGDRVAHLETGLDGQPTWIPSNNASGIYLLVVETNFVSGHYERFKTKVALVQ